MTLYLDTSVIVPLFTKDALSGSADKLMESKPSVVIISDFAAAEFASVISRRYRTGDLNAEEAAMGFARFDEWTAREAVRVETAPVDLEFATAAMRRLDLPLRTGDAIHMAIACRLTAELAGRWQQARRSLVSP